MMGFIIVVGIITVFAIVLAGGLMGGDESPRKEPHTKTKKRKT